MKDTTKFGYQDRLNKGLQIVQGIMTAGGCDLEKWQDVFMQGKELLDILYGGSTGLDTVAISNKIASFERRIQTLQTGAAEGLPVEEVCIPKVGIFDRLRQLQQGILEVYADMLQVNPLAREVAAVQRVESFARSMTPLMQELARLPIDWEKTE